MGIRIWYEKQVRGQAGLQSSVNAWEYVELCTYVSWQKQNCSFSEHFYCLYL